MLTQTTCCVCELRSAKTVIKLRVREKVLLRLRLGDEGGDDGADEGGDDVMEDVGVDPSLGEEFSRCWRLA